MADDYEALYRGLCAQAGAADEARLDANALITSGLVTTS
jgi:hypothetical protein